MEPLYAGIPVLFGPYMESKVEMKAQVTQNKLGQKSTLEGLPELVQKWVMDSGFKIRLEAFLALQLKLLPQVLKSINPWMGKRNLANKIQADI